MIHVKQIADFCLVSGMIIGPIESGSERFRPADAIFPDVARLDKEAVHTEGPAGRNLVD